MNRLQLAQRVNEKAGTQGSLESTTNVTQYQNTIVGDVDTAYNEIQLLRKDWKFMKTSATFTIIATDTNYTNADIKNVHRIIYNKKLLKFVKYDEWLLKETTETVPYTYTVDESGIIYFNDLDGDYEITVQYYRVPDIMTVDADIPIIPVSFHWAIVWKALMNIGIFLGNWDLISNFTDKYNIEMGQLLRDQVPSRAAKHVRFA